MIFIEVLKIYFFSIQKWFKIASILANVIILLWSASDVRCELSRNWAVICVIFRMRRIA